MSLDRNEFFRLIRAAVRVDSPIANPCTGPFLMKYGGNFSGPPFCGVTKIT
jgi:hypothetical protein